MRTKRFNLGIGAGVLGCISALSSAFVPYTRHANPAYTFINVNGTKDFIKAHYQYLPGGVPNCESSTSAYCWAQWTQATIPTCRSHPTATANLVSGSQYTALYTGGATC